MEEVWPESDLRESGDNELLSMYEKGRRDKVLQQELANRLERIIGGIVSMPRKQQQLALQSVLRTFRNTEKEIVLQRISTSPLTSRPGLALQLARSYFKRLVTELVNKPVLSHQTLSREDLHAILDPFIEQGGETTVALFLLQGLYRKE